MWKHLRDERRRELQSVPQTSLNTKNGKERESEEEEEKETPFFFSSIVTPLECTRYASPNTVLVFSDFISLEEELFLLNKLNSTRWISLRHRRVQMFGGDPAPHSLRTPLPHYLQSFVSTLALRLQNFLPDALVANVIPKINHVLVNEYSQGQGIMPHTDGPLYSPCTCTLSLGVPAQMVFSTKLATHEIGIRPSQELLQLTLLPRCFVVFFDEAYTNALHAIEPVSQGRRVSLTFRHVLC